MAYNLNLKTLFSLLLIGIIGGCVGVGLTLLMHFLQHLTFNAPLDTIMPFRVMVEDASPFRRVLAFLKFNNVLIIWAMVAGPIIGIIVWLFDKSIQRLPKLPKSKPIMILISTLAFGIIGILSIKYPEILGNGKAANQLTFTSEINLNYAIGLFISKWGAVLFAMVAGAYGGRITPSMMLGGALGFVTACFWNMMFPIIPLSSAAIIAAAVFLGIAQKMPLTSAIFMLELSRYSPAYFYPICLCFATAMPTYYIVQNQMMKPSL